MRKFFICFFIAMFLSSFLTGCNDKSEKQKEADKKFMNMDNIKDISKKKPMDVPR